MRVFIKYIILGIGVFPICHEFNTHGVPVLHGAVCLFILAVCNSISKEFE